MDKAVQDRLELGDGSFGDALQALLVDKRLTRQGWNGKGLYIARQWPDEQSKMTAPYVYMKTVQGDLVPWVVSQTDLFAMDWGFAHTN